MVHELRRDDDALATHLRGLARLDLYALTHGDPTVHEALAAYDALPVDQSPLETLRHYARTVDLAAHADAPLRNARTLAAHDDDEALCAAHRAPAQWMGALLGLEGPAPLRVHPAYGRGGLHRYGLAYEGVPLDALWAARVAHWGAMRAAGMHPAVVGAVSYFDAVFLHPFDDGNARLARALCAGVLAQGPARAGPDFASLVYLPKRPGDGADLRRFVLVCARSATARTRALACERRRAIEPLQR